MYDWSWLITVNMPFFLVILLQFNISRWCFHLSHTIYSHSPVPITLSDSERTAVCLQHQLLMLHEFPFFTHKRTSHHFIFKKFVLWRFSKIIESKPLWSVKICELWGMLYHDKKNVTLYTIVHVITEWHPISQLHDTPPPQLQFLLIRGRGNILYHIFDD